eukprot:scaffold1642_cov252-Pinguiococcus_pyrenoidosus.AAC.23
MCAKREPGGAAGESAAALSGRPNSECATSFGPRSPSSISVSPISFARRRQCSFRSMRSAGKAFPQ